MAHPIAVEVLFKEKGKLSTEKLAAISRFDEQISAIDTAIEELTGKRVWEVDRYETFDDEHPDYIKGSSEEI